MVTFIQPCIDTMSIKSIFEKHPFLQKIQNKISSFFHSLNKFNLVNVFILIGFAIPLIYMSSSSSAGSSTNDQLAACNPYIQQPSQPASTSIASCDSLAKIDTDKLQKGIDVSHYQGDIQWDKVVENGNAFAIAKATGGESYVDPDFVHNWYEIRRHELIRGAYHFFYAGDDPEVQAQHFLDTVGKFRDSDLPPILDIEITDQVDSETLQQRALTWLQNVEKESNRKPIIYTDLAFAQEYLKDSEFGQYYLWLADYRAENPQVPNPWKNKQWFLLQYSEDGQVDGVMGNVDLNHYQGSIENLRTFIQISNL